MSCPPRSTRTTRSVIGLGAARSATSLGMPITCESCFSPGLASSLQTLAVTPPKAKASSR
jgi:hypothetical protein